MNHFRKSRALFRVLAIETSCDDTAIAIFNSDNSLILEKRKSQKAIHQPFGGVVPRLASYKHLTALNELIKDPELYPFIETKSIDLIAVTTGPGIGNCLQAGHDFAKTLASCLNIPLIPVNHLEGHLLSPFIAEPEVKYPFLAVLLSGGNSKIVFCERAGEYLVLGETLDDSIGEVFDKMGRLLDCSWSDSGGLGHAVEKLAIDGKITLALFPDKFSEDQQNILNFSFSGLKTAFTRFVSENSVSEAPLSRSDLAATIQHSLIFQVSTKLRKALQVLRTSGKHFKHLALIGGVARNMALRNEFEAIAKESCKTIVTPRPEHCVDNAVMIGRAAIENIYEALGGCVTPGSRERRVDPDWSIETLRLQFKEIN